MRAQLALEVANDIFWELDRNLVTSKFDKLVSALEQQVSSPNETNQLEVAEQRDQLYRIFETSKFNSYPPSLELVLSDMGVENLLGLNMKRRLEGAFQGNQLTPASALEIVKELRDSIETLYGKSEEFVITAGYFELRPDDLEYNEYEFSIAIPRGFVDNELNNFGSELKRLDRTFSVFSELATGSREDFKIKSISSSDLTIILESTPAIALAIVTALERLAAFYEKILNIISLHRQISAVDDMPNKVSEELKKHIEAEIKKGIQESTKSLEKEYMKGIPAARKNELRTEIKAALTEIASRMDNGFLFDVRGGDPEATETEDEEQTEPNDDEDMQRYRRISAAREKVRLFRAESEPVLRLPPTTQDEINS